MKHYPILGKIDSEAFEPSWVFSTAEIYVDMDLGKSPLERTPQDTDVPRKFRRPWYKLNYPLPSRTSLRLYKRPYFHIAED